MNRQRYKYIIKRILWGFLVLWGVSLISFGILHLSPGDPARLLLPPGATLEEVNNLREELGLNKPLSIQYLIYIQGVIKGDLGTSLYYKKPNLDLIKERMPATLILSLAATIIILLVGIPLGVIAGVKQGTFADILVMSFAILGQSMSIVWFSIFLIFVFAVKLGLLPAFGYGSFSNLIMPTIAIAFEQAALITRLTRAGMIDVLKEDYILAIRAKGIKESKIIARYAFKNILITITTMTGLMFANLMGGQMVIESIFVWPGIGSLSISAINQRDFPLVQSIMLVVSAFFVSMNLLVDILYVFLDPRLKYK